MSVYLRNFAILILFSTFAIAPANACKSLIDQITGQVVKISYRLRTDKTPFPREMIRPVDSVEKHYSILHFPFRIEVSSEKYVVKTVDPSLYIAADLSGLRSKKYDPENKVFLSFAMRTESKYLDRRMYGFRGKEQFDMMMKAIGHKADVIIGEWVDGNIMSTNQRAFNKYITPPHNLSYEEAALKTWTGQQAKRHGYDRVVIRDTDINKTTGEVEYIFVEFHKGK